MRQVSPNATLLTPVQCKSLWIQFTADITYIVNQAKSAQVPYHELLCTFIVTLFVRPFSVFANKFLYFLNFEQKLISIWNAPALFQNCITCFIFQLKFLILNLTSTLTRHAWYFPQEARKQAKKVIQQMFRLVLLAMMTLLSAYGAMGIAAKPEVAAVMKEVWQALAVLMKDLGPEVLAVLKDEVPKALSFLGPQMVAAIMALLTKMMARWR